MASASLSFNLAPFSSLPMPPPHALIEPAPPSLIPQRPWRTPTIPRPQAIHAPSLPSCSSSSSSSSRRRAFSTPRAFPNNSSAIDEDPEPDQFLRINSISDFIRFKRGEAAVSGDIVGELQTAVVSYRKRFPWSLLHPLLQVDLVSAIHIADKEYFETLQIGLDSYDCVLYEMVASKESLENKSKGKLKPKKSKSFIGFIQKQMAGILSLNFQLDCLDYESEKWQHADLDFETFQLLQDERGENFFTLAKEMMLKSPETLIQPSIPSDLGPWKSKLLWASRVLPMPLVGLLIISSVCLPFENDSTEYSELEALSRLDAAAALKIFLAKRLTSDFAQITAVIEENSVIIGERNRVAAEALRRAVDSGHQRIAILYGGGHMPDLGRRLREEFDMVPSRVKWITAWSIRNNQPNINSSPFLTALAKLLGWPLDRYQTLALLFFSATLALDLWLWELFFHTVITLASSVASKVNLLTGIM